MARVKFTLVRDVIFLSDNDNHDDDDDDTKFV